jgi:putative SbcD/Mre11-related phosphoesterase
MQASGCLLYETFSFSSSLIEKVMTLINVQPVSPYPALLFKEGTERTIIVADLHIGWEISLVAKGIHIPSQMARILARLTEVVRKAKPTRLILLGDIKQTVPRISTEEWKNVPEFLEAVQKMVEDVIIVPGNHDGDIEPLTPRSIQITPADGIILGKKSKLAIFHGHAWPKPEALSADILVMSHIHPVVRFQDRMGLWTVKQVWVKGRCDGTKMAEGYLKYSNIRSKIDPKEMFQKRFDVEPRDNRMIIMPTFNDLIGGLSVNRLTRRLKGPILGSSGVDFGATELYLLDGTFLGTVNQFTADGGQDQQ